ncbi:4-carboxy-4-hydroxy-2-oxoadipate aldolase/oxaloacetate decarboxylase [Alicyclobacillus acidocaldarius]|uniref:Putative 4-hydroxy-4-methyl-2-oxoglutarate aldolase n=1 Tax=Alicyclobacillus acidocaldarius (strain Tc-4-1) TaxID=1048834 RepID=F8IJB8_ALIAT|nr:4-carboxy-4-hydroxy-2-oxoadipate aldolase/oxaloacetate decarboxylase [Alicyclobacillus acidocaldarius]AEJ43438.1 4-carboxy-4-hydroxy-2-oxoadipate aldolase/oxaloacetate decarboxylase [Alicyclobacillus acidocaldarius subsp. acidocaldarius Tc-4-1]
MRPVIVTKVERPERALVEHLGRHSVATLHEAMGRDGLMLPYMRPIYRGARAFGTAVTVLCQPGDNLMIHASVEVCQPGDVLVVTTTSPSTDGMFGELLATSLQARGVAGLVIEAGVRDVAELEKMGFPVWSRAISARGTVKATPGCVNVPIVCAGICVRPGDVIVADMDGVVCVPQERALDVAAQADVRVEKEEATRARLAAGELGIDLYGLRDKLRELGVTWI